MADGQSFFADLGLDMRNATFAAAYDLARERGARAVSRPCPFGSCQVDIDPLDGTIVSAVGPVGCGCGNLPGWRSQHWDGLPKPGWTVKAVGRHGGRIAASRRKHAEHGRWLEELRLS